MLRRFLSFISLAVLSLWACGAASGGQVAAAASGPSLQWIVASSAVTRLLGVSGATALVASALDNPGTYVVGSPSTAIASWHVHWARSAKSLADVQSMLGTSSTPALSALLYDQEHWSFTPTDEQTDPAPYVQRAESAAHQRGLKLIAAPATDLVYADGPVARGAAYQSFLKLGLAGRIARYADVYDIQAQGAEANVAAYQSFVDQAAAQARSANPHVILFAGLSTNPGGQHVTAKELEADVAATRDVVSGYWLNVPSGGAYCPACGTAQPQIGVQLLQSLYGGSGSGPAGSGSACLAAISFTDMGEACWASQAVSDLAGRGIVNGFPDGSFHPNDPVTRAEFVKMLDLVLGLKPASGGTPFADTPDGDWYTPYVAAAVRAGIVEGTSPATFSPDGPVTREQLAVMLTRALGLSQSSPLHFTDDSAIDPWAMRAVEGAVAAGYLNGFPDGSFRPRDTATRAQAAKVLALVLSRT